MLRGGPALVGGLRGGGVVMKAQGLHDMAPVVEEQHEAMVDCDKPLHIGRLVPVLSPGALPAPQEACEAAVGGRKLLRDAVGSAAAVGDHPARHTDDLAVRETRRR